MPRILASALTVTMLAGTIAYGGYALSDDAAAIVAQLPEAAAKLRQTLHDGRSGGAIQNVTRAADELQRTADEALRKTPDGKSATNLAPKGVQRVQVEEPDDQRARLPVMGVGEPRRLRRSGGADHVLRLLPARLRRYVQAQAGAPRRPVAREEADHGSNPQRDQRPDRTVPHSCGSSRASAVGVATWIAFRMVGLEQAGVWGMAAGIFNSIPYFGPVIVAAGTAVVGFLQFGTLDMAFSCRACRW